MPTHDLSALRRRLTVKLPENLYTFDEPTLAQIAALSGAAHDGDSAAETADHIRQALKAFVPGLTDGDADYLLTPRVFEAFVGILTGTVDPRTCHPRAAQHPLAEAPKAATP